MVRTQLKISSDCNRFELVYWDQDGIEGYDLAVVRNKEVIIHTWNNYEVYSLLRSVSTDSHTKEYLDLMFYCSEWGFEFEEVKKILSEMYAEALGLGIFEE